MRRHPPEASTEAAPAAEPEAKTESTPAAPVKGLGLAAGAKRPGAKKTAAAPAATETKAEPTKPAAPDRIAARLRAEIWNVSGW